MGTPAQLITTVLLVSRARMSGAIELHCGKLIVGPVQLHSSLSISLLLLLLICVGLTSCPICVLDFFLLLFFLLLNDSLS